MKFLPSPSSDYGDYGRWYKPVFPRRKEAVGKADSNYVKMVWKSLRAKLKKESLFTGGLTSTSNLDAIASDISFLWQYHANQCWVVSYTRLLQGKKGTYGVGVPYPGPYWLSNEDDPAGKYSSQLRTGTNLHAGGFTNWWGTQNKLGPGRVSIPGADFDANWQVYTGKETQRNVTPAYAAKTLTGLKMLLEKQKALYMGADAKGDWTTFWGCFANTYNPLIKMLNTGIATAEAQATLSEAKQSAARKEEGTRKAEESRKAREYWKEQADLKKAQESLRAEEKAATRSPQRAPSPVAPPDPSFPAPTTRRRSKSARKRALAKKKAKQKKRNLTIAGSVGGIVVLGVIFLLMRGRGTP